MEHVGALPGCDTIDSGIYNCRPIRGAAGLSTHAEGRALDLGVRLPGGWWPREEIPEPGIWEWANKLFDNAECLGVLYVIYARRSRRAGKVWRPYRGSSPHWDHLHIELSREAAAELTPQYIKSILLEEEDDPMASEHVKAAMASLAISDIYDQHGDRPVDNADAREYQLGRYYDSDDPKAFLAQLAREIEAED